MDAARPTVRRWPGPASDHAGSVMRHGNAAAWQAPPESGQPGAAGGPGSAAAADGPGGPGLRRGRDSEQLLFLAQLATLTMTAASLESSSWARRRLGVAAASEVAAASASGSRPPPTESESAPACRGRRGRRRGGDGLPLLKPPVPGRRPQAAWPTMALVIEPPALCVRRTQPGPRRRRHW